LDKELRLKMKKRRAVLSKITEEYKKTEEQKSETKNRKQKDKF